MAHINTVTITKTTLDTTTGEVHEITTEEKKLESKRKSFDYTMLLGNLHLLNDLTARELRFLLAVSLRMVINSAELDLSTALRKELAKELNLSLQSVRTIICKLVKKQLLKPSANGKHMVSPYLFHRGSLTKIEGFREQFKKCA
ncbi:hypothetical protein PS1M3_20440 [Pseudoalteromonas sp. PS1M3]|uniref:replication/maintenance protein RepL n=1 Tax=Pseudoalteromonas sp. PS1M3 TaxID=87791 RepID=UPI001950B26D|nr:replication/maintenance protein RepL [Pseudoalteromonas sp. PS1M3]BBW91957.1 hypothetical protein PS1M3_20440 [Pseudoalteromonas sp. PS1M3]